MEAGCLVYDENEAMLDFQRRSMWLSRPFRPMPGSCKFGLERLVDCMLLSRIFSSRVPLPGIPITITSYNFNLSRASLTSGLRIGVELSCCRHCLPAVFHPPERNLELNKVKHKHIQLSQSQYSQTFLHATSLLFFTVLLGKLSSGSCHFHSETFD